MSRPGPRKTPTHLEPLEPRTLLSADSVDTFIPSLRPAVAATVVYPFTSAGGVILHEKTGVPFVDVVGSFSLPANAPATNLHASIFWGDGNAPSDGTITPVPTNTSTLLRFNVTGSHDYLTPGMFPIRIIVTQDFGPPGFPGSAAAIRLLAVINSKAIVSSATLNLAGTITGKYLLAPTAGPSNLVATYIFNGTGAAGDMGPVSASAQIQLAFSTPPGTTTVNAPTRSATGTLTLTSISTSPLLGGTVTLHLSEAPLSTASPAAGFPSLMLYTITAGTGAFADATGSGTIAINLDPLTQSFTFTLHSA